MKGFISLIGSLLLLIPLSGHSQLPYTEADFEFTVETNIEYGQATNYAGLNDTLLLDIYKPLGDENCTRPCLVFVHGGAWIAGSKDDASVVNVASEYAKRGWVVATVKYRLGTHKTSSWNMYAFCNESISAPCGYIADSAEIYRANYRGQQDVKGAIRFMKNRFMEDSTDVNNFFLAGESAGGFVSLTAAFMKEETEKPSFCNAIDDAPVPDAELVSCLPTGYSLSRPDLGPVEGSLNLGTYDASVQGVGSIYGGLLSLDVLSGETDWPAMYLFHQGSDVVVHYNYYRLLGRIDWECFSPTNLCQNYAKYPKAYGSKGLNTYFDGLSSVPDKTVEIIENYEYQGDCFDNGHSVDSWAIRLQNMAEVFAQRLDANGNSPTNPPCGLGEETVPSFGNISVYPNPSTGALTISGLDGKAVRIVIYNELGQEIQQLLTSEQSVQLHLEKGFYLLNIRTIDGSWRTNERVLITE